MTAADLKSYTNLKSDAENIEKSRGCFERATVPFTENVRKVVERFNETFCGDSQS